MRLRLTMVSVINSKIEVAESLAKKLGVAHKVMDVTLLNELAISSLTRDDIPVSHELQRTVCQTRLSQVVTFCCS